MTEDDLHIAGRHTALDKKENDPKEEDEQLKDTNNKRLSLAMPHSGLKPKNENDPKEEDDL